MRQKKEIVPPLSSIQIKIFLYPRFLLNANDGKLATTTARN